MDENNNTNFAGLCGTVAAAPVYSHSARGTDFYTFPLSVERLSGASDVINVILRREQLEALELCEAEKLRVTGEVRSFNNRSGSGAKLVISVFAKELCFFDGDDENLIRLHGTLCKAPNKRTTPMGRDICDLMLAVNRRYGRSDYLPCITWGQKARDAAAWEVGTVLDLEGRIQSRRYIKLIDGKAYEKTAYEISVTDISAAERSLSSSRPGPG